MKKFIGVTLSILICGILQAQVYVSSGMDETKLNNLREEFQTLFRQKDHQPAMEKAVQLSEEYIRQDRFREAATVCYQMDQLAEDYEKKNGKRNFLLRFMASNQRLHMYVHEKKAEASKAQLDQVYYCISYLKENPPKDDLLFSEAEYFYTFGMTDKSMERYTQLLQRCVAGSEGDTRENCYKTMLAYAEQNKIEPLTNTVQVLYTAWQDSIQMVQAAQNFVILQKEHEALQQDLKEKENTISNNKLINIGLITVIVILVAGLLVILFILFKSMFQTRKYKQSLKIANESNAQKSDFISNINTQITPTLDFMEEAIGRSSSAGKFQDSINSLRKRIENMQIYISLEESREEPYPVKGIDINSLSEYIMTQAKASFKPDVEAVVSVPKVNVKTNAEALSQVLTYLLSRAAFYTDSGKISLEFKKRNARTGQFFITDTGTPISPEEQESIFKPFINTEPNAADDGWTLPICKLMAHKLNGTLRIDTEYKKGTRFILDFCS